MESRSFWLTLKDVRLIAELAKENNVTDENAIVIVDYNVDSKDSDIVEKQLYFNNKSENKKSYTFDFKDFNNE